MGGVGKSTLAAYLYNSLDFDAKFWADVIRKPNFTVFAEKIIVALGGKVSFPIDITDLINNLLNLLSQQRCLLVVDNLETLLDEERNWQDEYYQQFFSRWQQQGTKSTLFVTTQDKPKLFQGLEHWYALGGMKIAEGIRLFQKFAIQGKESELKEFVEYLNGHPLTIKLVAKYLKEYYGGQFSKVIELELKQFDLAYQEAEGLHRNKEDARLAWIIQQHLDRLNSEQKQFLTNLSVYRLSFDLEATSYQWIGQQVKPIVIRKKLQELCNRSLLIQTEDNKFQFESLVQKYILQKSKDLANAHQQAIQYYRLSLKEEEFWQILDDINEYLEIVYHQYELKQYILANNVLNGCTYFLYRKGYYSVLRDICENLISRWHHNLRPEEYGAIANSMGKLGNAYYYLGKVKKAIQYYQNALKFQQQIGDIRGIASSLMSIGNAHKFLGEYVETINYNKQSLEIQKIICEHKETAISLGNLGDSYFSLGDYEKALKYYKESLRIRKRIDDKNGIAESLIGLGNIKNHLKKYQQAIKFFEQSLEIKKNIGDQNGKAKCLMGMGIAYYFLGEHQQAIEFYQQSLKISQDIGSFHGIANSLHNLGIVYHFWGNFKKAIELYEQSLEIKQQIGDYHGEANSLNNLGELYQSQGEYQKAIDRLQKSLKIAQRIRTSDVEAVSWFNLGDTWKNLMQKSEAITAYKNAKKFFKAIGSNKKVEECNKAIQNLLKR